ncbi:MAG: molecular chaperone DnaJ, partial [Verrucomicrobiales bacterium]|nr:molecular chaperone DnaJ [Verrucomicrobiales bacterium]
LVNVQVEVPVKLNKKQEELLTEFAETVTEKNHPVGESFFAKAKRFFTG